MRISFNAYITNKCNFACRHCCHLCDMKEEDMTEEELLVMMNFIISVYEDPLNGFAVFGISGGEPTLHPKFYDILRTLAQIHVEHRETNQFAYELHTNAN